MAKFHLTAPDGATYEVDAPDEYSAVAALKQATGVGNSPARAASPVTDPALLAQLNAPEPKRKVTDPALLATLNSDADPIDVKAPDG